MADYLVPENEPANLRQMQEELLRKAEAVLGTRDTRYQLGTPEFDTTGPFIRVIPDEWAVAILSRNAAGYWPCTIWELSPECIHLLDPTVGSTNYFEEGIAVVFQEEMTPTLANIHHQVPDSLPHYIHAKNLVNRLPGTPFEAARMLRKRCGALRNITMSDIQSLFPDVSSADAQELATTFGKLGM